MKTPQGIHGESMRRHIHGPHRVFVDSMWTLCGVKKQLFFHGFKHMTFCGHNSVDNKVCT
jgi:hypothetical protein